MTVAQPAADALLGVARRSAARGRGRLPEDAIVWAAGSQTWRRLAARGVWVHGCADGLGDDERSADRSAGRARTLVGPPDARRARAPPDALATYHVETPLPDDLPSRIAFLLDERRALHAGDRALAVDPRCAGTRRVRAARGRRFSAALGASGRVGVWLDRDILGEGRMPVSTAAAPAARWSSLRLRQSAHLRDLCAETSFTTAHLVQPIFVVEGLAAARTDSRARRQLPARPRRGARVHRRRRRRGRAALPAVRRAARAGAAGYGAFAARGGRRDQAPLRRRAAPVGRHLPVLEHRRRSLRDLRRRSPDRSRRDAGGARAR